MNDTVQHQAENHPAWEDWEDQGGFDDEESLMEKKDHFSISNIPEKAMVLRKEEKHYSPNDHFRCPNELSLRKD